MPQLSDSLAKLSERAKAAEEHAANASTQTREEIEARISEIKADSQRRRSEIQGRAAEVQGDPGTWWSNLSASANEQLDELRSRIDERREDHDAEAAERRADRAEASAAAAIEFALYLIGEAEASLLEAAEARATAEALR